MQDIKYLVFSGGGAAGYAYAGAIDELGKVPGFSLEKIKGTAGSSVGSLAALMIALNYTPSEACEKLSKLNLRKLQDGGIKPMQIFRFFRGYGRYRGKILYDFIKNIIKDKINIEPPESVTFADLKEFGFKDLRILVTKLYKKDGFPAAKQKVFSYETTPNTSVALAIRASTAAPVLFPRVRLKKNKDIEGQYVPDENGHLYNDGGLLNHFPIEIFDDKKFIDANIGMKGNKIINPHTLGFALVNLSQISNEKTEAVKTSIKDYHPIEYTEGLFNSLLLQLERTKLNKDKNRQRTILIDKKGVQLGDFGINEAKKQLLIQSGRDAVKRFFSIKQDEKIDDDIDAILEPITDPVEVINLSRKRIG